jgi:hypothetical protein
MAFSHDLSVIGLKVQEFTAYPQQVFLFLFLQWDAWKNFGMNEAILPFSTAYPPAPETIFTMDPLTVMH